MITYTLYLNIIYEFNKHEYKIKIVLYYLTPKFAGLAKEYRKFEFENKYSDVIDDKLINKITEYGFNLVVEFIEEKIEEEKNA